MKRSIKLEYSADVEIAVCDAKEREHAEIVDWVVGSHYSLFTFSSKILSHPFRDTLVKNWAWELPLLLAYARLDRRAGGTVRLNLGDIGTAPGLAYCDFRREFPLIPDPIFVRSDAYREFSERVDANSVPWSERKSVVFWRGSTTGWHTTSGGAVRFWQELPRVVLARLAQSEPISSYFDVGISGIVQRPEGDEAEIRASGVMRGFVAPETLSQYKAHIDIDGNTNAWMSLFTKLASGSPVLKVQSPCGFKQWYYDRLVPWKNYVPVHSSMNDLREKAEWIFDHPIEAQRIGEGGRALARSMTLDSEIGLACPTIANAIRRRNDNFTLLNAPSPLEGKNLT